MKKYLFAVLAVILLGALLYAGPSIFQIYQGGTGQSSFSAGVLRSSGTALSSSELSGDVTTSGSNAATLASVVTAGSCGDSTHSCGLTYDAKGRITAASNNAISGGGGGGSGVWILLCTGTASTSLTLDFSSSSNCSGVAPFTGTYTKYAITFGALYDANSAGGIPILVFSTNGGSSYDTAANYGWAAFVYGLGTALDHVTSDNCFNLVGFSDIAPDASGAFSGTLFVTVPSTGYAHIDGTVTWGRVSDGGVPRPAAGNTYTGSYKVVTLPNAFRFHFDPSSCSGTAHSISAGTIKVYGIT